MIFAPSAWSICPPSSTITAAVPSVFVANLAYCHRRQPCQPRDRSSVDEVSTRTPVPATARPRSGRVGADDGSRGTDAPSSRSIPPGAAVVDEPPAERSRADCIHQQRPLATPISHPAPPPSRGASWNHLVTPGRTRSWPLRHHTRASRSRPSVFGHLTATTADPPVDDHIRCTQRESPQPKRLLPGRWVTPGWYSPAPTAGIHRGRRRSSAGGLAPWRPTIGS